jgi:ribosomal protein L11 methyltransferase
MENADMDGVAFREIWEGSAAGTTKQYDVVIANIVADVLVFIAGDLKRLLKDEGVLILSGILDKYEDKVLKAYADCGIVKRIQHEEWVTLVVSKKGK